MKAMFLVFLMLCTSWAAAQELEFHPPASAADPAVPALMRDLASRILPVYQESDQEKYLRNVSALQMAARNYPAAHASREQLRDRRRTVDARRPVQRSVIFDMYAQARDHESEDRTPFPQAFTRAYWDTVGRLNDQDAYNLTSWLGLPVVGFQESLQKAFDQWRPRGTVPLPDAIELLWTYLAFDAYRNFHPLIAALDTENDTRRYVIDWDVVIDTPDGATLSAVMVRPKDDSRPLPALLEFTINVDAHNLARECAAHGYVGIVAFSRGERRSVGPVTPFEHDGADARAVINWITRQSWSDGRVGMYGTSYSAFTQWAAATRLPTALKAMATTSAIAPGVDFPMYGNIVHNWAYRWSGCVSNSKGFDEKTCNDDAQWRAVDEAWYKSGKSYRNLDRAIGGHNLIFHRWLDHASYDRYWQKFVPFRAEFAKIDIPVLATTGYFAGGAAGTLHYFQQHFKYNPKANQTLVIGPYDDGVMQHGTWTSLLGYQIDPAAQIDLRELRYQWFDHIFKAADLPALLQDRVNYQMMGANEWRHAPSLEVLAKGAMRYYLDAGKAGTAGTAGTAGAAGAAGTAGAAGAAGTAGAAGAAGAAGEEAHGLVLRKTAGARFIAQQVNLADRSDASWTPPTNVTAKGIPLHNALLFVSEPLRQPVEVAGLLSGKLDFTVNRQDLDLNLSLYELLPNGDSFRLFEPAYEFRASYVQDPVNRHLLKAGERQQLAFRASRMTGRRLEAGSRIAVVLGVNKRADRQINYGTGYPVNDESIEDARIPLKIRWYTDTYFDVPVRH